MLASFFTGLFEYMIRLWVLVKSRQIGDLRTTHCFTTGHRVYHGL